MGVLAESLDELQQKEAQTASAGEVLNNDITLALNDVNDKYAEIEKIKTEISEAEQTIQTSESEIETTEQSIERRKEVVGDRMKDIQLSGEQRTWQVLLEAENLTDFFNKAYAMTVLQNAEQDKIDSLTKDKEKLAELQTTVKTKQAELEANELKLQQEASVMNDQVLSLKEQLSNNQAALQQIASEKQTEEQRIADEKEAQERKQAEEAEQAAKAAEEQAATATTTTSSATDQSTSTPTTPTTTDTSGGTTTSSGKVLYMQSTAYSWREQGSGYITATGIDLRSQSNVIAVDKTVIPLGSLVEVEGYGYAVAGDTGGAIKGNIIDVHFPTVEQCTSWGRKYNVKVVIL